MEDKDKLLKLIAIAKNPLPEDELKRRFKEQPVKRFVVSDGLEDGDVLIQAFVIYHRYKKWAETYRVTPISNKAFFTEFSMYFPKKQQKNGIFYRLSPKGFNLSPEYVELIRKQINGTKKKKAKKKSTK